MGFIIQLILTCFKLSFYVTPHTSMKDLFLFRGPRALLRYFYILLRLNNDFLQMRVTIRQQLLCVEMEQEAFLKNS
jgi:hypothetical protein